MSLVSAALLAAACGKDGGGSSKTATIDLFGKKPVPPGELAKVKPGMTQAQVKALFPKAAPKKNHSGSPVLTLPSGYSNAEFEIGFYGDKDEVANVEVEVAKDMAAKLESVWGPPTEKRMWPVWNNEEDGYEVSLMEMGRKTSVSYRPFVTLTPEFFGKQPGPVDALTKVKLGMTREEVAKAAPGLEGAPKGGGSYIPYKAGPKGVDLSVEYHYETDKVEGFRMRMPKRGVAAMEKAWGPGQKGKVRGSDSPMECWDTPDKTMKIEVRTEDDPTTVDFVAPERSLCQL